MTIVIAASGQPLPEHRFPGIPLHVEEWRIDITVHGFGGVNYALSASAVAAVGKAIETRDLGYLHNMEYPTAGAICRTCPAVYCNVHATVRRIPEGGGFPFWDYHYEMICPAGHLNLFGRD